ncbi:MAG TPA: hypothetical protein VF760_12455 [Xanthobacteraceae bacterium]
MTSRETLREFEKSITEPAATTGLGVQHFFPRIDLLVQWMKEVQAQLDYLHIMVESPKERP